MQPFENTDLTDVLARARAYYDLAQIAAQGITFEEWLDWHPRRPDGAALYHDAPHSAGVAYIWAHIVGALVAANLVHERDAGFLIQGAIAHDLNRLRMPGQPAFVTYFPQPGEVFVERAPAGGSRLTADMLARDFAGDRRLMPDGRSLSRDVLGWSDEHRDAAVLLGLDAGVHIAVAGTVQEAWLDYLGLQPYKNDGSSLYGDHFRWSVRQMIEFEALVHGTEFPRNWYRHGETPPPEGHSNPSYRGRSPAQMQQDAIARIPDPARRRLIHEMSYVLSEDADKLQGPTLDPAPVMDRRLDGLAVERGLALADVKRTAHLHIDAARNAHDRVAVDEKIASHLGYRFAPPDRSVIDRAFPQFATHVKQMREYFVDKYAR